MKKTPPAAPAPVLRKETDPAFGLTDAEVARRVQAGLCNTEVKPEEKTVLQIILSNVFTYFNLLFFFLALCLVFTGSGVQNLLFLGVVFCNTAIGTVQELRAKRMLDRLKVGYSPRAHVIRGGKEREIPAEELVADDIVRFVAGNQLPADAVVVAGNALANESLVTGEADEIAKGVGDTLLSGSYLLAGEVLARLTHVGRESFVSRLTLEAKRHKKVRQHGMMRSLSVLVRIIGFFVLPLGAVLFWQQYGSRGVELQLAMESSVSAIIGMIPEGLYLLASAALALAVIRLGRRGILSHNLGCVETLARVDVLCLDKTGTITEDSMELFEVLRVAGCPYSEEALREKLALFAAASGADNVTAAALKDAFPRKGACTKTTEIPFSSGRKFSALTLEDAGTFALGAPEVLLKSRFDEREIAPYLERGMRVLIFCAAEGIEEGALVGRILPLAFVVLENRVREEARETFRYFAEQGVCIKVISGDHPAAVSAVCLRAGIRGAEDYVDASTLVTQEALFEAAERYTVFGRVTPQQKKDLIRALKEAGHTVAMTGDGVNDVLALKEADCSVAMASGSEVAANVSQIVLLNNDFAAMPHVVAEGRQVINNIQRSAALYLVKNIFSFCTAIFLLFLPLTYPIQPVQLSLVSALTIGIPSFFLALEPNRERVSGSFLRNIISRALPAGLTDFLLALGVMLFSLAFSEMSASVAATVLTLLLCLVGFLMLFHLSRPFNRFRTLLFCLLVAAFFVLTIFFPEVFLFAAPGLSGWLLLSVFVVLAFVFFFLLVRSQSFFSDLTAKATEQIQKKRLDRLFSKKKK